MTPQLADASPRPRPFAGYPGVEAPSPVVAYAQGEQIYAQGDPAGALYVVVAGAVRTVRHSSNGRRQIGDFYYPGDLFGLEVDLDHDFSAEAMCETLVRTSRRFAAGHPASADRAALRELARAHDHLAMLGRRSAEEKVASFLLDLARRGPADRAVLPMSRQDMADYLGLALETVSRVLGRLQDEGLVVFLSCRDFRVVRRAALERLAET